MNIGSGRLAEKVAIVTGGGSGIGRATVKRFVSEGARLVVGDIDEAALSNLEASYSGVSASLVLKRCDISKEIEVLSLVKTAIGAYGRLDILVANAGVIPDATLDQAESELWDYAMAVNGRGMFLSAKYAAVEMAKIGHGSIVFLSSISAFTGQLGQAVYGPTKFVASGLTKHLAIELAPKGIRVNAVAPGTIDTPAVGKLRQEDIAKVVAKHPLGRIGTPEEVANAILFLASEEASFITGTVLPVDGGYLAQ